MDCSPQGSSVHGILQARVLEWVATAFSYKPLFLQYYFSFQGGRKVEFPTDPKVMYIFKEFYSHSIFMKTIPV